MGIQFHTSLGSSYFSKDEESCFCGKYLFRFLDEEVAVRVVGGPSGGGIIRGILTKINVKSGIFIVESFENGSSAVHHICCKAVSSIEQSRFPNVDANSTN